jgi:histidinol-phosphate aminotransferase
VIAQRPVIEGLKRVMPPYPVSTVTARIGQKALERTDFLAESVHRVRRERERMILALAKSPLVVSILPSETNFLLVRFRDRDFVFERLLERGLCMRRRSEPELFDCLRLTIGTIEQNSAVLDVLDEIAIPSEPTPAEAP